MGSDNQDQDFTTKFVTKLTEQPTSSVATKATTETTASIKITDYAVETASKFSTNKAPTSIVTQRQNTSTNVYENATTVQIKHTENAVAVNNNSVVTYTKPIIPVTRSTIASEATTNRKSTVTKQIVNTATHQYVENITVSMESLQNYTKATTQSDSPKVVTNQTGNWFSAVIKTKAPTTLPSINGIITQTPYITITQFKTTGTVMHEIQTTTDSNFPLNLRSIAFSNNSNEVCETASCKLAAVDILTPMNHSVDPCDDFYEFSCGRFVQKKYEKYEEFLLHMNRMPNTSSDYLKAVKIFFDSCVSHESEFLSRETIQQGCFVFFSAETFTYIYS